MRDEKYIAVVRRWVENVVVEFNLCPFASRELKRGSVRFSVTEAQTEEQLLLSLDAELNLLDRDRSLETTLLIHPNVLNDFFDYNQFLSLVDALLLEKKLEGVYQVASFHPDYQFAGTDAEDVTNYTNRSPYPILHILREESVARAIAGFPDVGKIPRRNIELMNELGAEELKNKLSRSNDDSFCR